MRGDRDSIMDVTKNDINANVDNKEKMLENGHHPDPKESLPKWLLYFLVDLAHITVLPAHLGYRFRKYQIGEKYKEKGGALIVVNHSNLLDPLPISLLFTGRFPFYLAGEAVMTTAVKRFFMGCLCIEINRNISDIESIRQTTDFLKAGRSIIVYPQGGVKKSERVDSIKSGVILMALQGNVPIIPVYLGRRDHWWERKVAVIGETMDCKKLCTKKFPSMKDMDRMTEELLSRMQACEELYEEKTGRKVQ